ncbi:MAG TPA: SBBP repeat-containing protein, partial [Verrucomicrobiae bacterium]|nr:SBBP repeat-containing protein [Verrucomicrobiae bacterium]
MSKNISRIFRTSLLLLAAGAAIFSTRADQPPEILYATAPYTAILNLGATNSVLLANASVCDAAGNFYVTGSFEGTAKFGTNVLGSNGGYAFDDMYVVKYDPAGNVLWARQAGGTGKDFGTAITLDGAGGIYVAGTSDSYPATFGTNILYMLTQSLFVVHYDGNGNLKWVERGGSTGFPGGTVFVNGIAHDAANNVIVAGSFKGSPNFGGNFNGQTGNQTIYLTNHNTVVPTGSQDTYLAKFDAGGNLLWAINPGGPDNDYANAVAVDSTGAIYTSGGYTYTNVLGGQTYTNSNEGIFLAKFSGTGDFVWSSNLSDPTNSNPGRGLALAVDGNDRITLSLQGNNSGKPFAFRGSNYALAFGAINLLAQFDVNGNLYWLKQLALNTGSSSLTVDKQNNLYLGGSYQANV